MICQGMSRLDGNNHWSSLKFTDLTFDSLKQFYRDLLVKEIIPRELNDFKRMSLKSKQAVIGAALALHDGDNERQNNDKFALLSSDKSCCESENRRYFADYVKYGRVMGRGNLFVNTLPTTPLAEVSMAFALRGPLYYVASLSHPLQTLLQEADLLLELGEAEQVMTVLDNSDSMNIFIFTAGEEAICYRNWQSSAEELFNTIKARYPLERIKDNIE